MHACMHAAKRKKLEIRAMPNPCQNTQPHMEPDSEEGGKYIYIYIYIYMPFFFF